MPVADAVRHDEPVRALRRAAGPAAWLLSTAVATAVAWWAVTAVGARGEGTGAVLSESQVATALAAERAALAASPTTAPAATPSAEPTPDPTTPATPVVRTWSLEGGVVSVACEGDAASLEYATPASGWRVDAKERGPGARVLVELEREGVETYVQAVCVAGTPEYSLVADDSGSSGGDDHGSDDGGDDDDDTEHD